MTNIGDMMRFGNPSQDATSAAFSTISNVATDPTAVTLVVQKPDGAQLAYGWPSSGANGTLTKESAGRFYFDVPIDQAGEWRYRLAGTGAVTAAGEGRLSVQPRVVV